MWGKVLKVLCEKAEGRDLYILEADKDLNWFGVPLSKVCSEVNLDGSVREIVEGIRSLLEPVSPSGQLIAYLDPINYFADIYPADRPRYRVKEDQERPFAVTRSSFRVGFFESLKEAADLFLEVSKDLRRSQKIKFDVVYI
jgi:hypothetical protein